MRVTSKNGVQEEGNSEDWGRMTLTSRKGAGEGDGEEGGRMTATSPFLDVNFFLPTSSVLTSSCPLPRRPFPLGPLHLSLFFLNIPYSMSPLPAIPLFHVPLPRSRFLPRPSLSTSLSSKFPFLPAPFLQFPYLLLIFPLLVPYA